MTLVVSPETAQRVERAKSQGADIDALLRIALELWFSATDLKDSSAPRSLASLAGKYEGEAWDEFLTELERNRPQEMMDRLEQAELIVAVQEGFSSADQGEMKPAHQVLAEMKAKYSLHR